MRPAGRGSHRPPGTQRHKRSAPPRQVDGAREELLPEGYDMLTSEVLDRAADEIERRGWTQGGGWFPCSDGASVCVEGALKVASGYLAEKWDRLAHRASYDALAAYLRDLFPEGRSASGRVILFVWNDWPDRTSSEVVEALRACALIERARESADEPAIAEQVSA